MAQTSTEPRPDEPLTQPRPDEPRTESRPDEPRTEPRPDEPLTAEEAAVAAAAAACPPSPCPSSVSPDELLASDPRFTKDKFDFCESHSHDPRDLALVASFVELMGVRADFSLTAALSARFGSSEAEVGSAVRLLLRCLRLLHLCGYPQADIEVMVAHASSYLKELLTTLAKTGQQPMGLQEITHVLCLLIYLAHSYVEDQTCPLRVWHQHLFKRYCDLATLNAAVLRLLEQMAYVLRVSPAELQERLSWLKDPEDEDRELHPLCEEFS